MGGRIFLLVAALLLVAPSVYAQVGMAGPEPGPEPCFCAASPGSGAGMGDSAVHGVPNGGEPARCTGLRVAYRMREVDRKAKITEKTPQPAYTEAARANRVTGVVRLRVVLCPSGAVSNISIVKGLPDGLTEQAIAAARKVKFEPAEKDGQKVAQYQLLEYSFWP